MSQKPIETENQDGYFAREGCRDERKHKQELARKDEEIARLRAALEMVTKERDGAVAVIDGHVENVRRAGLRMAEIAVEYNLLNIENHRLRAALEQERRQKA